MTMKIWKKQSTIMNKSNFGGGFWGETSGATENMRKVISDARHRILADSRVRQNWQEWVEALESGEYEQDRDGGMLWKNDGFCCLGVACHLVDSENWRQNDGDSQSTFVWSDDGHKQGNFDTLPPSRLMEETYGIPTFQGWDGNDVVLIMRRHTAGEGYHHGFVLGSGANDDGETFATIAQAIRNTYLNPVYEQMGLYHMIWPPQ